MITILSAFVSLLSFRLRSRAGLELELVALRHQVAVLRRQRKGRLRFFSTDRLLWVWLYRIWPQVLDTMVLVKPATIIQWHRKGFRLYWRWRSRHLGRPKMGTEIRDLIPPDEPGQPALGRPLLHQAISHTSGRTTSQGGRPGDSSPFRRPMTRTLTMFLFCSTRPERARKRDECQLVGDFLCPNRPARFLFRPLPLLSKAKCKTLLRYAVATPSRLCELR